MKLIDLKNCNIEIHSLYKNNNNQMTKLYLDENSNLIFKLYFFPKYKDEETEIYNQEFIIYQNKEIKYKFHGKNLSRQTSIQYENKILKKNLMYIYFVNLNKIELNQNDIDIFVAKNIIQTHEYITFIPKELIIYNLDIHQNFRYYFFNNKARRRFIKNNFEQDVLDSYDMLIPGAYQADFFRLLVLFILGGVYMDHKIVLSKDLNTILFNKRGYFVVNDFEKKAIYNAFLIFEKGNMLLKKCIELLKKKILNKYILENDFLQFGPRFFKRHFDLGGKYDNFYNIIHSEKNLDNSKLVVDKNREIVFFTSYGIYYCNVYNENHYAKMFYKNQIIHKSVKKNHNYFFYLWNHFYSDDFDFEIKNNNLYVIRTDKQEGFAHNHILKIVDTLFNKEKLIEIGPSDKPYKIIPNVF